MLRRSDPSPESSEEQTQSQDHPVRSVIVIGASAGGQVVIGTVLKDLSHQLS
jgi:chemotaxis response regulator CheB